MPLPGAALRLLCRVIDRLPAPAYPAVEDELATLEHLVGGASIARYGDGEQAVMYGHDIAFQRFEPALAAGLWRVFRSTDDGFLVALVPPVERLKITKAHKLARWRLYEKRFAWPARRGRTFASAFVFRFKGTRHFAEAGEAERTANYLRIAQIWRGRDVVVVGHDESVAAHPMLGTVASRHAITCPLKHAFSDYERIRDEVLQVARPGHSLVLLSAGPMATVLAHDLFRRGLQTIDAGHLIHTENFPPGSGG